MAPGPAWANAAAGLISRRDRDAAEPPDERSAAQPVSPWALHNRDQPVGSCPDRDPEGWGRVGPEDRKQFPATPRDGADPERPLEIPWRDAARERSEHQGECPAERPDAVLPELTRVPNPAPDFAGRSVKHGMTGQPAAADADRKEPGRDAARRRKEWAAPAAESDAPAPPAQEQQPEEKQEYLREKYESRAAVARAALPPRAQVVARLPEDVSGRRGRGSAAARAWRAACCLLRSFLPEPPPARDRPYRPSPLQPQFPLAQPVRAAERGTAFQRAGRAVRLPLLSLRPERLVLRSLWRALHRQALRQRRQRHSGE